MIHGRVTGKAKTMKSPLSEKGFTIAELVVAMAISGVVMAGIYAAYYSQQKAYIAQDQVAEMQQNLRVAFYHLESEVRTAGYDPTGDADAGILIANAGEMQITKDDNEDGDTNLGGDDPDEEIHYFLTNDADGDGINDGVASGAACHLAKDTGSGPVVAAENIDAVHFVYLDEDGNVLDDDGNGNVTTNIDEVNAVQITLVARTGRPDLGLVNANGYEDQQGNTILSAQNDGFRRQRISTEIKCRNMGL